MNGVERIASPANPLLVQLRRLLKNGAAYRRHGLIWLEGEHLCTAALARGLPLRRVLYSERGWAKPALRGLFPAGTPLAVLADSLFAAHSSLDSPGELGAVAELPAPPELDVQAPSLILDRVQDPGNVGSLLRSAAAFGVRQVLALEGCAALWSPKVLRAGMGAHFALKLIEGADHQTIAALRLPMITTSSHHGQPLQRSVLPAAAAWVFGHEGQGVAPQLAARCAMQLRIEQPGGEESLNVAAAAAVCLYEWARQRARDALEVNRLCRAP